MGSSVVNDRISRVCMAYSPSALRFLTCAVLFIVRLAASLMKEPGGVVLRQCARGEFMLDIAKSAPTGECAMDWTKSRRVLPARKRLGGRSLPPH